MKVTRQLIGQLAGQFGAGLPTQSDKLGPWARVLMTATLAVSAAVALQDVQAQQQQQRQVMPERSAVNWGGQLGTIFGAAAGAALGQNVDPAVRRVIVGASAEAGRNAGHIAIGSVYQGHDQQSAVHRIPEQTADHLDRLGLNAAFAYDEMMRIRAQADRGFVSTSQAAQAQQRFNVARDQFAGSVRSARMQGHSVETWTQMSTALQQRFVNEQEVAFLAQGMAERLNRPGGPGFQDPNVAQDRTSLSDLRDRMAQQRQHDVSRYAPVMR